MRLLSHSEQYKYDWEGQFCYERDESSVKAFRVAQHICPILSLFSATTTFSYYGRLYRTIQIFAHLHFTDVLSVQ